MRMLKTKHYFGEYNYFRQFVVITVT